MAQFLHSVTDARLASIQINTEQWPYLNKCRESSEVLVVFILCVFIFHTLKRHLEWDTSAACRSYSKVQVAEREALLPASRALCCPLAPGCKLPSTLSPGLPSFTLLVSLAEPPADGGSSASPFGVASPFPFGRSLSVVDGRLNSDIYGSTQGEVQFSPSALLLLNICVQIISTV